MNRTAIFLNYKGEEVVRSYWEGRTATCAMRHEFHICVLPSVTALLIVNNQNGQREPANDT
jgi:hypothetical protein